MSATLRHTQLMYDRRLTSAPTFRSRLPWSIFGGVSTVVLGTCFFATLRTSSTTSAGLVLLGGLIVIGIAAALMYSILSPLPEHGGSRHGMGGGFDGGGFGAGDFGGGDCGG
jgi:hypothetical protein